MSFEGRYQKLCSCGHYEEQNVYMESKWCSQCGKKYIKSNLVDDTNEYNEGYDYEMVPEHIEISTKLEKAIEELQDKVEDLQDQIRRLQDKVESSE